MIEAPLYPINLRVDGQPCLVVGGGPVASRKVDGLLAARALVTVVAPHIVEAIASRPEVRRKRRRYQPGEVAGYRLAIAATGEAAVDAQVYADGEAQGVLVNSADDPAKLPVHPAGGGPPGTAAGHLLDQRRQSGPGHLVAPPLRR